MTPDKSKVRRVGISLAAFLLLLCSDGWAVTNEQVSLAVFVPDYEHLADSIRKAEGNDNYGILTHYKHTSYRQACINTCKHAWKDYLGLHKGCARNASNSKIKATWMGYSKFLADRYCPIGASNDPTGLNKHWLGNVRHFYERK